MADTPLPGIEIHSVKYAIDGNELEKKDIPEGLNYERHNFNKNDELLYTELRDPNDTTLGLKTTAHNGNYQTQADAVLTHAISTGAKFNAEDEQLVFNVVVPAEFFKLDVVLDEGEQYQVVALFGVSVEDTNAAKAVLRGFIVEVFVSDPIMMHTRKIQYTAERQLYSIHYILFAIDDENKISYQHTFNEYSDIARAEIDATVEQDDHAWFFPTCDQAYLDEAAQYLALDLVLHADLENNQIADDDVLKHSDFKRQWFNREQQPTIQQIFLNSGIGQSEIHNVPQALHMKVLHAYLRLMHKHQQRFSTDSVRATHYILMLEPVSTESSETVPLEPGQTKHHQSTCTSAGIVVSSECVVFAEDGRPLRQLTFASPNEVTLMYERVFHYDDNGQPLEPEIIDHRVN